MKEKLEKLKANIDAANNQPVYAVAAKMKFAEQAVNDSYDLLSCLVNKVQELEDNAKN